MERLAFARAAAARCDATAFEQECTMRSTSTRALARSSKSEKDENFPVAPLLLPAHLRPHVKTFYRFARTADDIADNPTLHPSQKITALAALEFALESSQSHTPEPARAMRDSLAQTQLTPQHCKDLLRAFAQDATKSRYASWTELMDYCRWSAAPVGRYLIDLHGGPRTAYPASDALCSALQVLNHLQDCQNDYLLLNRVYIPQDWLQDEGLTASALAGCQSSAALRRVLNRCLAGIENLLSQATPLPTQIAHWRLAMDASAILAIAGALTGALKRRDPLAERVALSAWGTAGCIISGVSLAAWQRLRSRSQVRRRATTAA